MLILVAVFIVNMLSIITSLKPHSISFKAISDCQFTNSDVVSVRRFAKSWYNERTMQQHVNIIFIFETFKSLRKLTFVLCEHLNEKQQYPVRQEKDVIGNKAQIAQSSRLLFMFAILLGCAKLNFSAIIEC